MTLRVAPVGLVALVMLISGCGEKAAMSIDHTSARQLAISAHEAAASKDYSAMAEAMSPDFRPAFREMLMSARDYVSSLESLSAEVERKIGAEQATRFRRQAQKVYAGTMADPLDGALRDGKVDWNAVIMFEEGEVTSVAVAGTKTEFDRQFAMVCLKDQWFVVPRQGTQHGVSTVTPAQRKASYEREAKLVQTTLQKYTKLTDDFRRKVGSGAINAGNFAEVTAGPAAAP